MNNKWVAAWGCPIAKPSRLTAEWIKDTTVRFNVFMTLSGSALRFHFSNLFSDYEAEITRATVSLSKGGGAIDKTRLKDITFSGKENGKMEANGNIVSDEIPFEFTAGDVLTVSLYIGDFAKMSTAHQNSGEFIEKWLATGDNTHEEILPVNSCVAADTYPFIHTIDALCSDECYSIIAYGDSITAQSWPDRLSRRINALGKNNIAVVRKAISGSRVLREYPCDGYRPYGPKGRDRFEREVLLSGVKKVYILHGINDIIHPDGSMFRPIEHLPTPEELIEGLKFYIDTAHKNGIQVYISPILPFKGWRTYNEEKEAIRIAVNDWIRNEAEIEGVIDLESAVADPDDFLCMKPEFDSGDHLHPSSEGAQAMADSIPEEML